MAFSTFLYTLCFLQNFYLQLRDVFWAPDPRIYWLYLHLDGSYVFQTQQVQNWLTIPTSPRPTPALPPVIPILVHCATIHPTVVHAKTLEIILDIALFSTPEHLFTNQMLWNLLLNGCQSSLSLTILVFGPMRSNHLLWSVKWSFKQAFTNPSPCLEWACPPAPPSFLWNCSYSYVLTPQISV